MDVSIRSYLSAGIAAATVGAIVAAPIQPAPAIAVAARSFTLSAAVQPLIAPVQNAAAALGAATTQPQAAATASATAAPTLPDWTPPSINGQSIGNAIINIYNAVEPWFQWGWEVVAWAASWVVGALAQQINIIYDAVEPPIGAVVYSLAYLLDGEFSLIGPTLISGLQASVNNLIVGEIAWVLSFFPPLPPIGSVFGAAVSPAAAAVAAASTAAAETSAPESAASGIEADPDATGRSARTAPSSSLRMESGSAETDDAVPAQASADSGQADELSAPVTEEAPSPASDDTPSSTSVDSSSSDDAVSGSDSTASNAPSRSAGPRAAHKPTARTGKSVGSSPAKSTRGDRGAESRR
ncbi:MAG: hypothetical protein U0R81_09685 [Mycobacterium sp.]